MLNHIILHLARSAEYPEGSDRHGYELIAPLDGTGLLDPAEWKAERSHCWVRRFWLGEADRIGMLVHRAGGAGGATWLIDYDPNRAADDEAGYRLNQHHFVPGEYISIQDEDEKVHTFQIVSVRPAKQAAVSTEERR